MEARELQGRDSDGGFNTLVCQEDFHDEELKTYSQSNQNKLQGTRSYKSAKRNFHPRCLTIRSEIGLKTKI